MIKTPSCKPVFTFPTCRTQSTMNALAVAGLVVGLGLIGGGVFIKLNLLKGICIGAGGMLSLFSMKKIVSEIRCHLLVKRSKIDFEKYQNTEGISA